MNTESLIAFLLASGLISFAPGPDNLFVLTQSALYGKRSGIIVTLGLCTGLVVHTCAVALGIAALFQTSPLAFNILKYAGAAYLLYLAWQAYKAKPSPVSHQKQAALSVKALYLRGIIMNVTNPKVSIFFLAFLPQFVHPGQGNLAFQFIALGATFIVVAFLVFSLIATMAGYLAHKLSQSPKSQLYLNRIAGVVFVGLAAKLVASSAH